MTEFRVMQESMNNNVVGMWKQTGKRTYSAIDRATVWRTRFRNAFLSDFHCLYPWIIIVNDGSSYSGIYVCGRIFVGIRQHVLDGEKNCFHTYDRPPLFIIPFLHINQSVPIQTIHFYRFLPLRRDEESKCTHLRWRILSFKQYPMFILLGCHMVLIKRMVGGLFGKSQGNTISALKSPPSLVFRGVFVFLLGSTNWTFHDHRPLEQVYIILQSYRNAFRRVQRQLYTH